MLVNLSVNSNYRPAVTLPSFFILMATDPVEDRASLIYFLLASIDSTIPIFNLYGDTGMLHIWDPLDPYNLY